MIQALLLPLLLSCVAVIIRCLRPSGSVGVEETETTYGADSETTFYKALETNAKYTDWQKYIQTNKKLKNTKVTVHWKFEGDNSSGDSFEVTTPNTNNTKGWATFFLKLARRIQNEMVYSVPQPLMKRSHFFQIERHEAKVKILELTNVSPQDSGKIDQKKIFTENELVFKQVDKLVVGVDGGEMKFYEALRADAGFKNWQKDIMGVETTEVEVAWKFDGDTTSGDYNFVMTTPNTKEVLEWGKWFFLIEFELEDQMLCSLPQPLMKRSPPNPPEAHEAKVSKLEFKSPVVKKLFDEHELVFKRVDDVVVGVKGT